MPIDSNISFLVVSYLSCFYIQRETDYKTTFFANFALTTPLNGHLGDSNCPPRFNEQFRSPKCPFKPTLVGLFDPNSVYQTVRLNALCCTFTFQNKVFGSLA
jgi:hypothetical protein